MSRISKQYSVERSGSLSKLGIVLAVAHAPAELRRSRTIVVASAIYFVIIIAAWIAFADSRGI